MIQADKTVRVFISSTFRDMHAERDHLVTVVFPELRERLERLGLELFDVDRVPQIAGSSLTPPSLRAGFETSATLKNSK